MKPSLYSQCDTHDVLFYVELTIRSHSCSLETSTIYILTSKKCEKVSTSAQLTVCIYSPYLYFVRMYAVCRVLGIGCSHIYLFWAHSMSIHIFRAFHIWAPAIFANSQHSSNNIAIALAIAPLFDSFVTPTIFVGGCSLRYIKQKTFKTATFHHIFHTANNLFEWMYEYHSVASSFYEIYVHQFSSMWMNNKTVGRQTEIDEERESER